MALANYSDLQAAVANWMSRSDLASRIPEGIVLAEAKINRRLRTLDMVTQNTSFSIAAEYVAVPANFAGVKTFYRNGSPRVNLDYMADDVMSNLYQGAVGPPGFYNVQGSNFRFGPVPDGTYTATLAYWLKVPALAGATANWLMTSHPDCYLYMALGEMQGLAKNWDDAQKWEGLGYQILQEIADQSSRDQWGGNSMAVRLG